MWGMADRDVRSAPTACSGRARVQASSNDAAKTGRNMGAGNQPAHSGIHGLARAERLRGHRLGARRAFLARSLRPVVSPKRVQRAGCRAKASVPVQLATRRRTARPAWEARSARLRQRTGAFRGRSDASAPDNRKVPRGPLLEGAAHLRRTAGSSACGGTGSAHHIPCDHRHRKPRRPTRRPARRHSPADNRRHSSRSAVARRTRTLRADGTARRRSPP